MQLVDNIKLSASKFLDARQYWESLSKLNENTDILMPNGFQVYCAEENKWYHLDCIDDKDPSTYEWKLNAVDGIECLKEEYEAWEEEGTLIPDVNYYVKDEDGELPESLPTPEGENKLLLTAEDETGELGWKQVDKKEVASDAVVEVSELPEEKENVVYKTVHEEGSKKLTILNNNITLEIAPGSLIPKKMGFYTVKEPDVEFTYDGIVVNKETSKDWPDIDGLRVYNCTPIEGNAINITAFPAFVYAPFETETAFYIIDDKNSGSFSINKSVISDIIYFNPNESLTIPEWYTSFDHGQEHPLNEDYSSSEIVYSASTRTMTNISSYNDTVEFLLNTTKLPDLVGTEVYAKDVRLLTEFDADKLGKVKTVNKNEPDENGNITVDIVKEVSELPEEKENVIYKIVDDQRKVYTDIGTIEVVQVPGSYVGDLYVPIMSPFICDVNGVEYEVSPTEDMKFIFGSETELPAIAYVIDTNKNQLQFRGVSNKEETFVLRKVDIVPQSTDVYAKDVRLLTENDSNLIQAVKEVDALPEELENVVYKVGASGAGANEVLTPCDARQMLPTVPANTGIATFIIGKEYMFNFDHISMSYGGFTNRPYDWEDDGGEYAYYNIKKTGDDYEITGLPAFIIYRESTGYDVYAFADMTKGHYFETDAPSEKFTPKYDIPAQATVKVPTNYTHYRPDYGSSNIYSLSESFDLEDLKYDATTRTMTCKNEGSGTQAYFTVAEDGINKLSSDSFTMRYETGGINYHVISAGVNDDATTITVFGDEYGTAQDFYKNILPESGPTALPAYGYSATPGERAIYVFQSPNDGIFIKPSDNKIWIEMDYSRDDPPRYIPTCVTRIKDQGGTIHSTSESFEYVHSSYGISYDVTTRILTMTGSSSDIFVNFEVPAPVGNLAISSLTKVYAKDIELATKTNLDSIESKVDGKLTEFVTLDTEQSVTGKKTFKDVDVNGNFNARKIEDDVGSSVTVSKTQASMASEDDSGSNSKYSSVSVNGSSLQLHSSTADEQNGSITVNGPSIEENTHNDYGSGQHTILTDAFEVKADTAKVNQKNIVRSVQGNEADSDGAVEIVALTELLAKVPAEASSTNQLADKGYVNDAVSSNSSNYISDNGNPFTSVEALRAYTGTVTHNDYAFVTGTDEAGNTYFDRYKASVSGTTVTWAKEYRLNNSSFTQGQWNAINSGITSTSYGGASRFIQDAGDTANTVEVAYSGTGLTKDTATHFAAWGPAEHDGVTKTMRDMNAEEAGKFIGKVNNAANADNATNATNAGALSGFTKTDTQGWGVQTGSFITGMSDGAGGDLSFRKNCPSAGQTSLVLDGTVYVQEGMKEVATKDAVGNVKGTFSGGVLTLNLL